MTNRAKYFEKLQEKRRMAHERAKKVQEKRKRMRDMKEEVWTTRNEFGLVSEHRQLQRKAYIEKIRKESRAMLDQATARVKSHEEREEILKKEIAEEVQAVKTFIDEQCNYYDDIHKQISPPKERSVEQIVTQIERELEEIYHIFSSVFTFDPKMPEKVGAKEEEQDQMFAKEIAQLEKELEESTLKAVDLEKEIAQAKIQIETENVKFSAIEQEKAMEIIKLEKQIQKMNIKLDFIKQTPVEIEEINKLKQRVEKEIQRNTEYVESLKYIKEMINIKKAEKEGKKKIINKDNADK